MRLNNEKDKIQPVPISLESAYFLRSPLLYPNNLNKRPYMKPFKNEKHLINRWDLAQTQWYERFYLENIIDDVDTALESVVRGRSTTLVSFFTSQMIDIPVCLTKMKFAHSSTASNPRLRLISMLTRHGRRYSVSKSYSLSALNISRNHIRNCSVLPTSARWELMYTLFVQRRIRWDNSFCTLSAPQSDLQFPELVTKYGQPYSPESRLTASYDWFSDLLFHEIYSYHPTFSLFVQRVNKLKRRHSRGKSGQYEIIWKYVPRYKRLLVVLRWLIRDIQFQRPKTFQQRLEKSLETLLFNKSAHLVYRLRNFVHKFVYQRFRKTLLKTLHTVY